MSELQRLRDRIEQLEQVLCVDRSMRARLRVAFRIQPAMAPILGMLLSRNFVTQDSLYTVLFGGRPDCDWPDPELLKVQICKLRRALRPHGINIRTQWGEGWSMSAADKAKARAILDAGSPARVDFKARPSVRERFEKAHADWVKTPMSDWRA